MPFETLKSDRSEDPDATAPNGQRLGQVGEWLLLAALVLAPVLGGTPPGAANGADPALGMLRLLLLLAALCVGVAGPPSSPAGRAGVWGRMARAGVWALFGATLVSLLVHSRFFTRPVLLFALLPTTLTWLCYALVFTLCFVFARDRGAFGRLASVLLVSAAWVGLLGAREYSTEALLGGDRLWRTVATFFHANFTAGFFALCLPVAVAGFVWARTRNRALMLGALAALIAGVLATTGSRAGVAAALTGLLATFVLALAVARLRAGRARLSVLVAAGLLLGVIVGGAVVRRAGFNVSRQGGVDPFRAETWRGTRAMARAHPLVGAGPGTFVVRYPPFARAGLTTHAHSSYLQTGAEQGLVALCAALAALAFTLAAGVRRLCAGRADETNAESVWQTALLCGLCGGLVAAIVRSAFDSEWWLLGNGVPFWAVAGLVAGSGGGTAAHEHAVAAGRNGGGGVAARAVALIGIAGALALNLLLFFHAVALSNAKAAAEQDPAAPETRSLAQAAAQAWPPEPDALVLYGNLLGGERALPLYAQAAQIEPSGGRLFALAAAYNARGQTNAALRTLQQARNADPTSLGTLRTLAEIQQRRGDPNSALAAWKDLVRVYEGPTGQIVGAALFDETDPAWAYAALARDAAARGDEQSALNLYNKAAAQIEAYAAIKRDAQLLELTLAQSSGENIAQKREQVRTLYENVVDALIAHAARQRNQAQVQSLQKQKALTLARLAAFATEKDLQSGR